MIQNYYWHWPSIIFYLLVSVSSSVLFYLGGKKKPNNSYLTKSNFNSKKGILLGISFLIIVIVAGVRYKVGIDFNNYVKLYEAVSWKGDIVSTFNYLLSLDEPGYMLMNYVIKEIFNNSQVVFFVSSCITTFFIFKSILKEKDNINVGLALFIFMMMFYIQSFTLVRQLIAASIVLFSLNFIYERNFIKFILYVLLATSFHYSALAIIPFYFFYSQNHNISIKKIGVMVILVIIWVNFNSLIESIFTGSRYISGFSNTGEPFGVGQIIKRLPMLFLLLFFKKKLIQANPKNKIYIELFIFEFIIAQFAYKLPIINRLVLNFSISQILLIPAFAKIAKHKSSIIVNYIIVLFGLLYFFYLISEIWWIRDYSLPYLTFWGWIPGR